MEEIEELRHTVDVVCMNCVEDTLNDNSCCERCPVRKTMGRFSQNRDSLTSESDILNTARVLIKQINNVCQNIKQNTERKAAQLQECKERAYLDMCTDLAPYYSLYVDMGKDIRINSDMYIDLDTKIYGERTIVIAFHARRCYICTREKGGTGLSMNKITHRKDFKPYTDGGYLGVIDIAARNWFKDYSDEFKDKFFNIVQDILTREMRLAVKDNKERAEQLKQYQEN